MGARHTLRANLVSSQPSACRYHVHSLSHTHILSYTTDLLQLCHLRCHSTFPGSLGRLRLGVSQL